MTITDQPDCTVVALRPALRAIDEQQVKRHGHMVAIAKAKTAETARRRASHVLGRHWHPQPQPRVEPAEVADALRIWHLMHPDTVLAPLDVEDLPYAHWPPHGSERACHEGDCRRCELEQARDEAAQS